MTAKASIAMFGSSLVSAYWNGAATYYRGIIRALDECGFDVTFFEPDAYSRQQHRDMADPSWARVVVYPATQEGLQRSLDQARTADILIKANSPPTRVFEAAGAGACLICDAWEGLEEFLEPGQEVLSVATGEEVAAILTALTPEQARAIGDRARRRLLSEHTYRHRAQELRKLLVDQITVGALGTRRGEEKHRAAL